MTEQQSNKARATRARLNKLCSCLRPETRLKISRTKEGRLQQIGLLDGVSTWSVWDDQRHALITNGHHRTPLQVMLDWINLLADNPMEKPNVDMNLFRERKVFWIAGDPDMGKTHLAKLTAVLYAILMDETAAFCVWSDKLNAIMDSFSASRNGEKYHREHFLVEKNAGILVLDDLSLAKWSCFRAEKLFSLLEHRRFLPTLITSNYLVDVFKNGISTSRVHDDDQITLTTLAERIRSRLTFQRRLLSEMVLKLPEEANDK